MVDLSWFEKPDNLVDLLEGSVAKYPENRAFGIRQPDGGYAWCTYREFGRRVDDARAGLALAGVGEGDAVGIIANNRVEWAVGAFAAYGRRAVWVPMYEVELLSVWKYVLRDAAVKVLLVANETIRAQVEALRPDLPALKRIVVIDAKGEGSLEALEQAGRAQPVASSKPGPLDLAAIIYTSGTTGEPKGVELTHGNFTTNMMAGRSLYPDLVAGALSLNILPWAHVYGETAELYNFLSFGGTIAFSGGPATLLQDFATVRPTHLITVPRVFNRVYEAVWRTMREAGGLKFRLFKAAVAAAKAKRETGRAGFRYRLLDKLVLSKIREKFGGRLGCAISGSAKMNVEIAKFFYDVGIPTYDAYGTTETSPAVSMNPPGANKFGSVGRVLPKIRVVIDRSRVDDESGEGEIVVYGPNVMRGYHNKPEATAAVLFPDGGLHTGDRGRLDEENFLYVTGRFKEQFKLENGKFVFPAAMEEDLQLVPWVQSAMVHGDGRPWTTCLVVIEPVAYERVVHELGLAAKTPAEAVAETDAGRAAREALVKALHRHQEGRFAKYEIPKKYVFVDEPFSVDNGMLTQTLKLKRRAVMDKYGARLEALYAADDHKSAA